MPKPQDRSRVLERICAEKKQVVGSSVGIYADSNVWRTPENIHSSPDCLVRNSPFCSVWYSTSHHPDSKTDNAI